MECDDLTLQYSGKRQRINLLKFPLVVVFVPENSLKHGYAKTKFPLTFEKQY